MLRTNNPTADSPCIFSPIGKILSNGSLNDAEKLRRLATVISFEERERIADIFLRYTELSREAMCVLLGPPWRVPRASIAQHALYPLYCLEGRVPSAERSGSEYDLRSEPTPRRSPGVAPASSSPEARRDAGHPDGPDDAPAPTALRRHHGLHGHPLRGLRRTRQPPLEHPEGGSGEAPPLPAVPPGARPLRGGVEPSATCRWGCRGGNQPVWLGEARAVLGSKRHVRHRAVFCSQALSPRQPSR